MSPARQFDEEKKAMEENRPQIEETDGILETDCIRVNSFLEKNLSDTDISEQTELTDRFSEVNGVKRMKKIKKKAKAKLGVKRIEPMKVDTQSIKSPFEGDIANGKLIRGNKGSKKKENIKDEIFDMDQAQNMLNLQLSDGDNKKGTDGKLNENELMVQELSSGLCPEKEVVSLENSNPNQMDIGNPKIEICLSDAKDEVVIDEGKCLTEATNVLHPCEVELAPRVSYPCLKEAEQMAKVSSNRKLLVLDVNGLLAHIMFPGPKNVRGDTHILRRAVFKRPFCDDFLKFCFQNFDVGIWSSRSKRIIDRVVEYLLGDLQSKMIFCWDMDHTTQTGFRTLENYHKHMVCKELRKIWESDDPNLPWKKGYYNELNTLLLDDSPYKALLNPLHTAIFPNSYHYENKNNDNSLGPGGDLRLYLEGLLTSENVQKYVEQHPFGQCAINETSESWEFYSRVLQTMSNGMEDNKPSSLPTSTQKL